ncbi:MAG: DegT/DnrJ/EryC1/StrS family aminotransferase [Anaerolineae bacterium]|nr:DegT/DnrJ/EryC1/StrS family aminotransferase [Anaerolineae bacterium]
MPGPGTFFFGDEERQEVMEVMQSGYLCRYGSDDDPNFKQKVYTLEREFARFTGAQYCVAVNSGTSALMAALVALGIRPGDEVLVPGYTFIASMSAVLAVGGVPVLTEIDESLTMDAVDAENKISPRTRFILPVHMLGNPCDMTRIMALAKKYNLHVVEDCCQALGGGYQGRKLGTIGALGAFSLNIYKVINAGDGGMLITNDQTLYQRAFAFHDQGHLPLRKGVEIGNRTLIGLNMRMNELTGAYALGQLRKLERILNTLRAKKALFKQAIQAGGLEGITFRRIHDPEECATLLTVQFETEELAAQAARALNSKVVFNSGWHVYHNMEQLLEYRTADGRQPYHKNMLPRTDSILKRSINLSVGVIDPGLGADFGITPLSTEAEIHQKAEEFVRIVKPICG